MFSFLALLLGVAGVVLAMHYPIAPAWITSLFVVACSIIFVWPHMWIVALPVLLPVVGFAPWTGWITFEEMDLLVLATGVGGYGRMAWRALWTSPTGATRVRGQNSRLLVWCVVGLFSLSTIAAMFRGFVDAGGFRFGWFQGYHEPMNSVRLAKGFLGALLIIPLWSAAQRANPARAQGLLSLAMMLGLAAASTATIWERAAFTNLLNFSSDYRTTGLFWEMHVGGAALDGFLALTVPFALREFVVSRHSVRWVVAGFVLALGAYACLTTFSRGVYLATPLSIIVFFGLHTLQRREIAAAVKAKTGGSGASSSVVAALVLVAGFGIGASWMFQTSGYRGMAALLATMALMLPLARVMRGLRLRSRWLGMSLGAMLVMLALTVAWMIPKAAYWVSGVAALLTAALLIRTQRGPMPSPIAGSLAFATFLVTLIGAALVAGYWGETPGLLHAAPVLASVLAVSLLTGFSQKAWWPETLSWQVNTVGAMATLAAVIGVFGGGAYMGDRFSAVERDLGGRLAHWQLGTSMLHGGADWLLGKGLGRFSANYFLFGNPSEHPGDYRRKSEGGIAYLTLTGGLHSNDVGEIFRVTQRILEPVLPAVVRMRVRADRDVTVHLEICEKQLIYGRSCLVRQTGVKGHAGTWQTVQVELQGSGPTRGDWYAPRLLAFSMAIESRGGTADIGDVALTGADGRQLLTNGDFSDDMAHWFFSSDRRHLAWHIKSMVLNVLFEQGLVGSTLLGLMLAGAFWRACRGAGRSNPLAPAIVASLTGFLFVGLFDSLLDVPRVAWLFYLLLLLTLIAPVHQRSRLLPHR